MRRPFNLRVRLLAACWAAASLVFACHVTPAAQADDRGRFEHGFEDLPPWYLPPAATREDADALKIRWRAAEEELKTNEHRGAGTYVQRGAMRSGFLRWSPGAGFVYFYVYEDFAVIALSYGKVRVTPAEVVFEVERELRPDRQDAPRPLPRRWVAARWKTGDFFVPVERLRDFGNYVAGLGVYNDFNGPCCEFAPFFSKRAPAPAAEASRPVVPKEYERFIRRPIEAVIKSFGRARPAKGYGLEGEFYSSSLGDVTLIPVRIGAGRRHGVKRNLLFRILGAPEGQYLKVTRVGPHTSDGVVIREMRAEGEGPCYEIRDTLTWVACPPVTVGTRVTTSPR